MESKSYAEMSEKEFDKAMVDLEKSKRSERIGLLALAGVAGIVGTGVLFFFVYLMAGVWGGR